jgi:hypothetical protein
MKYIYSFFFQKNIQRYTNFVGERKNKSICKKQNIKKYIIEFFNSNRKKLLSLKVLLYLCIATDNRSSVWLCKTIECELIF